MAGVQQCPSAVNLPGVRAKFETCKGLVKDLNQIPQCLLHAGPATWVVVISTALVYAAVLPLLMAVRPSTAAKCD